MYHQILVFPRIREPIGFLSTRILFFGVGNLLLLGVLMLLGRCLRHHVAAGDFVVGWYGADPYLLLHLLIRLLFLTSLHLDGLIRLQNRLVEALDVDSLVLGRPSYRLVEVVRVVGAVKGAGVGCVVLGLVDALITNIGH